MREDLPIEDLLTTAVKYRPDLEAVRSLLLATRADTGTTIWGGVGPQLQAAYTVDSLKTVYPRINYGWNNQQKGGAGAGFFLGLSTFGQLKTAQANEQSAVPEVQRQIDAVRAAVVSAQENSATNGKLIPVAKLQLDAAREALRLTQANLQAGTALVIDLLQAENAADDARLDMSLL